MTRRIDAITPVGEADRRAAERRLAQRRAGSASRALVRTELTDDPAEAPAKPAVEADPGASVFAAQLMGQSGQRRGLKGGPPVLDAARSTYLGAEYSGPAERRPRPGGVKDSDA